jgi:hypothetical protein
MRLSLCFECLELSFTKAAYDSVFYIIWGNIIDQLCAKLVLAPKPTVVQRPGWGLVKRTPTPCSQAMFSQVIFIFIVPQVIFFGVQQPDPLVIGEVLVSSDHPSWSWAIVSGHWTRGSGHTFVSFFLSEGLPLDCLRCSLCWGSNFIYIVYLFFIFFNFTPFCRVIAFYFLPFIFPSLKN